jgi:hypothetical protein
MGQLVVFAFLSALYPTLIAATTVMLLLPRAEGLMLGFWLGAMITSVTCGLVIVFAFDGGSAAKTARHTVSPAIDIAIAALLLLAALALHADEDQRLRERYDARHPTGPKKTPKWRKTLEHGSPVHAFVIGILLSFPGIWYLAALDRLIKLHYSAPAVIVVVIAFCLVQLVLIEVPMLAFKIWPGETPAAIDGAKAWASAHGRQYAVWGLVAVAGLLVIRAGIGLLS